MVKFNGIVFHIMETPTRSTARIYAKQLAKLDISLMVRVCERLYDEEVFEQNGI
jgi:hypothetical protein